MPIPERKIIGTTRSLASRYGNATHAWMVAIVCLYFISIGCQHQQLIPSTEPEPEKNHLVYRINAYYKVLQARDYSKTQLFRADRRPQRKAERSSLASKLSFQLATYEIQSIHINNTDAQVVMHATVTGLDNQYEIVMVDHWQYIGNNWFVADSTQSLPDDPIQSSDQKMWRNRITW